MKLQKNQLLIVVALLLYIVLFYLSGLKQPAPLTAGGTTTVGFVGLTIEGACNVAFLIEWNLFSFCSEPANTTVEAITAGITGEFDYVLRWNATNQNFELWSVPAVQKGFTNFRVNESYFIHMKNAEPNFATTGPLRTSDLNLTLVDKWNAPTYPYEFTSNVTRYLATIDGRFLYMLRWNATTQNYRLFSIFAVNKPFTQIFKGEGQFIFVNATSADLFYNRTDLQNNP